MGVLVVERSNIPTVSAEVDLRRYPTIQPANASHESVNFHQDPRIEIYLESQAAQNTRPLYLKVAHNSLKVPHNCRPRAFQIQFQAGFPPSQLSSGQATYLLGFMRAMDSSQCSCQPYMEKPTAHDRNT